MSLTPRTIITLLVRIALMIALSLQWGLPAALLTLFSLILTDGRLVYKNKARLPIFLRLAAEFSILIFGLYAAQAVWGWVPAIGIFTVFILGSFVE